MVKAGLPEKTAMNIAGLATRSIFDRYNIVSVKDSEEAAGKLGLNQQIRVPNRVPNEKSGFDFPDIAS